VSGLRSIQCFDTAGWVSRKASSL